MRHTLLVLAVLMLLVCSFAWAGSVAQLLPLNDYGKQSLAAKGKTRADMEKDMPSGERIPLPVYPGSFYGMVSSQGEEISTISFLSKDSADEVVAWYREQLGKNWQAAPQLAVKQMKQVGVFVNSDKNDLSPMAALKYRQLSVAQVESADDTGFIAMMFDVSGIRSMIVMTLKPMM
jgi:hypothetical protein